jgi:hypothetical protein
MVKLDEPQIEHWRQLRDHEHADTSWLAEMAKVDAKRVKVRAEILGLLHSYIQGQVDTKSLRATFDQKTRKEWEGFGLKGLNGAMVLNQLVKYVPDQQALSVILHEVLLTPPDEAAARERMGHLAGIVRDLLKAKVLTSAQLQVARIPFLVSAWWHMQEPEQWPIFYPSGREVLEKYGLYSPTQDPIADYFAFRAVFYVLASTLELTSWQLEHLLDWLKTRSTQQSETVPPASAAAAASEDEHDSTSVSGSDVGQAIPAHTETQLMLAKIGKKLGCNVWIAANDHGRPCEGGKLGDWSVKALPNLGVDPDTQKVISLIDVLWLRGAHQVAAAFEIEHTTSIYSGLLRLSDLVAMSPNLNFPMYIVSPENRLEQVRKELSRPTFQMLDLHKRCAYISEESLTANAEHILKWATSSTAIDQLARRVGDIRGEEAGL